MEAPKFAFPPTRSGMRRRQEFKNWGCVMKAAVLHEHLGAFAIADLAPSFVSGTPIILESTCHPCQWPASSAEREQIWQYLDALALNS
jgi:hypothetical protein